MLRFILPLFLASAVFAQTPDPKTLVESALSAVGGKDRLLRVFRLQEAFHSGDTPEPAAGKKRSTRDSFLALPDKWWVNKKERGIEPAKDVVRAWTLDLLIDERSQFEILAGLEEAGKVSVGLRVARSVTPAMDFYFDKETALLRRIDWRGDTYRFEEWRTHDGVKYPGKTVISKTKTRQPWFYHEIVALERLDRLPEGLGKP